jgi:hypothetical protein
MKAALLLMSFLVPIAAAPMPVPLVPHTNQAPSDPSAYGVCTTAVEPALRNTSHWCRFGKLGSWPEYPNAAARGALKFGRQTMYRGPILKQKLACNASGIGSSTHATVAVSTKYLKTYQGGWATQRGACNKCVCVSVFGADNAYNKGLKGVNSLVAKYKGLSFMGRVRDRGSEMPDDCLDILQDRPYSYAPVGPDNPNAGVVNRVPGPRGFQHSSPEIVGVWTALWQFVPCTWTHRNCADFVASYGYKTFVPADSPGI